MSRDPGQNDCCDYDCTQSRHCPVRCTSVTTCNGGKRIDTEYDTELTMLDGLIMGARLAACLICAVSVVMTAFFFF